MAKQIRTQSDAKQAIAGIDLEVVRIRAQVAAWQQDKTSKTEEIRQTVARKNQRMEQLQDDIRRTNGTKQKATRRRDPDKQRATYENQIQRLRNDAACIDRDIANKRTDIAKYNEIKQAIKAQWGL